jgi:hypothetical protein
MTDDIDLNSRKAVTVSTFRDVAKRAIELQTELSQRLLDVNKYYLEQTQRSSTEAWELFWKINTTPSISDRLEACQAWMKGATERSAAAASYLLETTRSLSEIEMKMLKKPSTDDEDNRKAA